MSSEYGRLKQELEKVTNVVKKPFVELQDFEEERKDAEVEEERKQEVDSEKLKIQGEAQEETKE